VSTEIVGLDRDHDGDIAVVIDVIRAFTTAAVALAQGASEVVCVESLDQARALKAADPGIVLIGEERGVAPPGFDYGNSPRQFDGIDLSGATVVQRTSNGTRGLAWNRCPEVVAAAAVNATATADYVARHGPPDTRTLLVCTGETPEDRACAQFMAARLATGGASLSAGEREGERRALGDAIVAAVEDHLALMTRRHDEDEIDGFRRDVERCAAVDRYDFAMVGRRREDRVILMRVGSPTA
jgi:2-phosphosulfolactate phosphatase